MVPTHKAVELPSSGENETVPASLQQCVTDQR
jgi:hypothetical protein